MKKSLLAFVAFLVIVGVWIPAVGVPADEKVKAPPEKAPPEKAPPDKEPVKGLPFRDIDELIFKNLRFVINEGAKLINDDDPAGCYRTFRGALMMTAPMLGHHADLKADVEKGLKGLVAVEKMVDKAFQARELIDLIRSTLKKELDKSEPPLPPKKGVSAQVGMLALEKSPQEKDNDKDKKGLSFIEIDDLLFKNLRFVINDGANLINDGDAAGCYRTFRGALMMTAPMLVYHPELKADIEKGIKALEAVETMEDKAFKSRELIDLIRSTLRKELDKTLSGDSLWDRIGGETAVRAIVQELILESATDERIDLDRTGKFKLDKELAKKLEKKLVYWFSTQIGGPYTYTGKDMKAAHAAMKVKPEEFDAMMGHLKEILPRLQIPEKEANELLVVVYKTRRDIVAAKKTVPAEERLWARLGGEKAIRPMVKDLMTAVAADPKVNFSRGGKFKLDAEGMEYLENMMLDYFSSLSGGPLEYSGRDLRTIHAGMKITEGELAAMAKHLDETMAKHKVPDKLAREVRDVLADSGKEVVEPAVEPKKEDKKK